MSLIERVARAACEAGNHAWPVTDGYNDRAEKRAWMLIARAAIEALREPSPKMIAAAWRAFKREPQNAESIGPGPGFKEALNAMINASLAE